MGKAYVQQVLIECWYDGNDDKTTIIQDKNYRYIIDLSTFKYNWFNTYINSCKL